MDLTQTKHKKSSLLPKAKHINDVLLKLFHVVFMLIILLHTSIMSA